MLRKGYAATAALAVLAMSQTVYAAEVTDANCWRAAETKAARIQTFKTMLMVDALKCQDTVSATVDSYNGFLDKRRDLIVASKSRVQEHFIRLFGPTDGYKATNDYDTRVGNRLAASAIDPQRCETTGMYARLAASASEDDLVGLADMLARDAEVTTCRADLPAVTRPAKMVIPVWEQRAPAFAKHVPVAEGETAAAVAVVAAVPAQAAAVPTVAPLPPAVASAPAPVVAAAPAPTPAVVAVAAPVAPTLAAAATPAVAFVQPASVPVVEAPKLASSPVADRAETLKALQAAATALAQIAITLQTDASAGTKEIASRN